jgi:hypothetical protein
MMMTTTTFTAVATPHALVLTVSHGLLFRQPPSCAAALLPPFLVTASKALTERHRCRRHSPEVNRRQYICASLNVSSAMLPLPPVLRGVATPRYARDCSVRMRANPINVSV